MGYFGSIMGLGMFIGPALGGFLAVIDYSIPSLLAALMSFISVILTALFLKETVKVKKGLKLRTSDFFPVKDFIEGIKEKKLRRIFLVFLLFTFAFNLVTSSLSLFIKQQLGIGPEFVGFLMMIIGLFGILFRALALPRLIDKKEITFLIDLGLIFILFAMMTLFFANNIYILYLMGILFSTGGGLTRPMITADVSDKVKQTERGKAMGVLDSLDSISRIAGPLIGGAMIQLLYPGYLGLLGAVIVLLALILDLKLRNNAQLKST
jgi:DHA1 family tetracycline resistance protein-like MFS transporter